MIESIWRRLPWRIRTVALRLLGRERVVELALPRPPWNGSSGSGAAPARARTLTIRTPNRVDTESTEPDVLRGAAGLLATNRPWIICEVLAGRTEADLTAILSPLGYCWFRIDGAEPLEPRTSIEGDLSYAHMNWLFAPDEPGPAFWQAFAGWRRSIAEIGNEAARPLQAAAHGRAAD